MKTEVHLVSDLWQWYKIDKFDGMIRIFVFLLTLFANLILCTKYSNFQLIFIKSDVVYLLLYVLSV